MHLHFWARFARRFLLLALPCTLGLVFFAPAIASAHSFGTLHITTTNLAGSSNSSIDGTTLFNLIMITLVEITAVFWVGAQCWLLFVPQAMQEGKHESAGNKSAHASVQALYQDAQRRFEQVWAVPTLVVLLLANVGVIAGQILSVTGQWSSAFSLALLWQLASSGRFGLFWSLREISTLVALVLAIYILLFRARPRGLTAFLPSVNLLLGAILFIAISASSHASVVDNFQTYTLLVDWFHLVAAALWVGSILFIVTSYLPIVQGKPLTERVNALISTLPSYARLAITGMVILTVTGIFSSQVHLTTTSQLIDTAYGRTLIVKSVLVVALLITSISTLYILRPRLTKEYRKFLFAQEGVVFHPEQQVKLREERLMQRTLRITTIVRWEAVLGIAILLCAGLMDVFGGTLSAAPTTNQQPPVNKSSVYTATVQTTDSAYTVKLNVNPNRFGTNVFTVTVIDKSTGKATTNVRVSLFTTMLDMDMGTDNTALQPDGKGGYSGSGVLSMGGNWEIRVAIHTTDGALHEAIFKLYTPF